MNLNKKCPKCGIIKKADEYHFYFSKERKKYRIGNYCKPCAKKSSRKRAQKHYWENREYKLEYAKNYRKNNPGKIKEQGAKFTKKYREELKECYVAEFAAKALKCSTKEIHENPELLEAYKNNMKLKRKLKNLKSKSRSDN